MSDTERAALDIAREISLEGQRDDLRAQLEAVTRERNKAHNDLCLAREGEARLTRERDEAYAFAADREGLALELEAARETIQHGIELRKQVERERDAARESEARMRVALEGLLREEWMTYEGNLEATGHASVDDLNAALAALASTTATTHDYSGLCSAPSCGGHCGYAHARGCEAIREYLAEHGGDPYRAPTREPSERMMLVAEAVRAHVAHHIRTSPKFEGQLTTPADNGLLGRVAQDVENIDRNAIRAIVAKVTP